MAAPIKWGICSAGNISHDFAASLLGHEEEHVLAAVAARSLVRAQKFADDMRIPKAYGSYEELARDPNIDIVYIGSVNTEHLQLCKLYISHKKNVLCEKPLAMSLRDTKEILKAAKEQNVFFMEAVWTRFFPACEKIRDILSSGQLGDVKSVIANFGLALNRERTTKKALGGGALYDMGIYLVQFVTMVYGQAPISSYTHGHLNEDGVDESYTTTMLFPGSAIATISCTYLVEYPNDLCIIGTKGRIRIPSHFWAPTSLEWTNEKGETKFLEYTLPVTDSKFFFAQEWAGMYYEAEAVRQALSEGKKEHALICWKETELLATLMEKARRDLGMFWLGEEK